jgi:hypothetical protein
MDTVKYLVVRDIVIRMSFADFVGRFGDFIEKLYREDKSWIFHPTRKIFNDFIRDFPEYFHECRFDPRAGCRYNLIINHIYEQIKSEQ